ncbi:MAG TPA: indole-3-glycerol phosphate synthase TrpC [Thermoleophilia bacterium]|nr:indole-3-glycerol phosphate synthase TrpC [Thermoleophilia bacterium]
MSVLQRIVRDRRMRIELDKAAGPLSRQPSTPHVKGRAERFFAELENRRPAATAHPGHGATGHALIAEIKRRSPSKGDLRPELDPVSLALAYQRAGACAISVLTEPDHFGGSFEDLAAVSRAVEIAVLCKDFVVDPSQINRARAAGADLVLLMVAVLGRETGRFVSLARCAGLEPLVEVHTGPELDLALAAGARLVGVNNRDLRTLSVDLDVCRSLLPRIPTRIHAVAESGMATAEDLEDLALHGARAFLVGEALVTARDPGAALRRLARGEAPILEAPVSISETGSPSYRNRS